jgi:hypothetical protein
VQLGTLQPRLADLGVQVLAVVNTPVERARLYFRHRPTQAVLLADPEAATHRLFGMPRIGLLTDDASDTSPRWPDRARLEDLLGARINPTGDLPEPQNPFEANTALNAKDGFQLTDADQRIVEAHGAQLAGEVLIDRQGLVRWLFLEASEGAAGIGRFPSEADILDAARHLPG